MTAENKIVIRLGLTQIPAAIAALDLYFRMHLGQYDAIDQLYHESTDKLWDHDVDRARDMLMARIRNALMPDIAQLAFSGSRGIYNELNDPKCMDAYNLMCSVRRSWALHRNPHPSFMEATVDYREPTGKGRFRPAECVIDENGAVITMLQGQYEIFIEAASVYYDVLSLNLHRAFSRFTDDPELLKLAKEAEKYHPSDLPEDMVTRAQNLHDTIKDQTNTYE